MRDIVIIASIVSGGLALIALGIALWHTLRLEWLGHHGPNHHDRPN